VTPPGYHGITNLPAKHTKMEDPLGSLRVFHRIAAPLISNRSLVTFAKLCCGWELLLRTPAEFLGFWAAKNMPMPNSDDRAHQIFGILFFKRGGKKISDLPGPC
jgi:hypothetical protein